jgi:hypothetical protein
MGSEIAISISHQLRLRQTMKLTGRLLMAFALTEFIVVLCGLTVDEGWSLRLYCGTWFVLLDLGAVALIMAGSAVSKGSGPGRIVATLLSLFYTLSAMLVLTMTAFSGIGQIPIWRLLVVLVMGIWSGTNLLLLIRLCDLKSCLPRYSLRTLLILVLLVSIGLKGLRWLYEIGQPPPFASVATIEQRYEQQLTHLRKMASARPWPANAANTNNPINVGLFGREEILTAGITPIFNTPGQSFGSTLLKQYSTPWKQRSGITLYRTAGVEQPVVTLWKQQGADGERLQLAIYENLVINTNGSQVKYFIEFDLNQLRDTDPTVTNGTSPNK